MPALDPWMGMLLLGALQALWVLCARAIGTKLSPEAERKLYHAGNGALMFLLPLLVTAILPAIVWAFFNLLALVLLATVPGLQKRMAGKMYEVGRTSYGDFYFVIGVTLLYFFSIGNYYTYAVPLTMLSFADAASAIIGKRFGRHKFEGTEGRKSIEGSLSFFAVAFVGVLGWAWTLPGAIWWQILLIGLILGFLVMLVEAVAWQGLDNLMIPLGSYILLVSFLKMDLPELLVTLTAAFGILSFTLLWRRRTTLNDSALISSALFGYVAWIVPGELFGFHSYSVAGWVWLAIPVMLFLVYNMLFAPKLVEEHHEVHNVGAIFAAIMPGGLWLYLAFLFARPDFALPYSVAFAAVVMCMYIEQRGSHEASRQFTIAASCWASAAAMMALGVAIALRRPEVPLLGLEGSLIYSAFAVLGLLLAMLLSHFLLRPRSEWRWRWHLRAGICLLASLVAAAPVLVLNPPAVPI